MVELKLLEIISKIIILGILSKNFDFNSSNFECTFEGLVQNLSNCENLDCELNLTANCFQTCKIQISDKRIQLLERQFICILKKLSSLKIDCFNFDSFHLDWTWPLIVDYS